MFQIDVSRVITQLSRMLILYGDQLQRPEDWQARSNLGIRFLVRMDASDYGYINNTQVTKERSRCVMMSIIVTTGHRVYLAQGNDLQFDPKPEDYKNTCNHDSCWYSDGIERYISQAYFDAAEYVHERINLYLGENHKKAPKDMNQFCTFDKLGDKVFEFVRIKRGPKCKDNDYLDTLTEVTPVKFKITLED